jgi:hypothetical protein
MAEWRELVAAAKHRAKKDQSTFADLANRLIGKPTEYIDADLQHGGEVTIRIVRDGLGGTPTNTTPEATGISAKQG